MNERPPGDRPDYKVYKSRRGLLDRLQPRDQARQLKEAAARRRKAPREEPDPTMRGPKRERPALRRVVKWIALAGGAWILLSIVLFMVSAQFQDGVSESTENALSGGGSLLTGSTILVLGSDERPKGSKEPGAGQGPARSDSILLMHVGATSVRRLSIPRDTPAEIPGHGVQKINSAYAFGGAALTIETVEGFLGNGLEINHIIEVSFDDFPDFIDALGGIDVTLDDCVRAPSFGGSSFYLGKGEHHLSGRKALRFARVRKNDCNPKQDDRARAERQQQVMSAIRSRLVSPTTFIRLPWVSWQAPRTIRSDMRGPGLMMLFMDLLVGGSGETKVLTKSGEGLEVSEERRAQVVRELVGG